MSISPVEWQAIVIGAGPAGLAVGACLKQANIQTIVLEQNDKVGSAWHSHYDRLHLHTDKKHSALPLLSYPKAYPRYPSRMQVVEYLESYAKTFQLDIRFHQKVVSAGYRNDNWEVQTQDTLYQAVNLVVASGYNREPVRPNWPGQNLFKGTLLHSAQYKNGESFQGQKVLVVGFGNSGGEIAIDLWEHGAQPSIAIRSAVNVIPRELFGIPFLFIAIPQKKLSPRLADIINAPILRLLVGDLSSYGLRKAAYGPMTQARIHAHIPLIDVGTLKLIKEGHLKVQPGIQEFTPGGVKFTDGQQCNFDAVILATGFRPRVNSFLEENSTSVDQEGTPLQSGRMAASPGLYFCGYYIAPTGMLREIGMEAKQISASIAARKTSKWRNTHSMSNYTIETDQLTKRFGDVLAVDCVNLRVKPGEIYGFLGLNGAGKTTTIRALLGMIRPSAGKLRVLGRDVGPNGRGPWARVGHLVETPSAYPELTVRENLQVAARLHGISDSDAARRVIEQLNLGSYADRKAGTLSMGNLQRLGLARALLHGPELLILDEPANGLDPAGVVEIRELLQRLARKNGVTIFMSSHILTEVDQLATRIGIIHRGQLIEELDTDQLEWLRSQQLEVKTRNLEAAQLSLRSAGYKFRIEDETMVFDDEYAIEHPDDVARILVNAGNPPIRLAVVQQNLEDHFLQLTNDRRKGNGVAEEAKA